MASCFFILKQFDDVLLYLSSIKSYFYNDDTFNFNFGQAKAATANFKEAEEVLLLVQSEKIRNDYIYISWLARCCQYQFLISSFQLFDISYFFISYLNFDHSYNEQKAKASLGVISEERKLTRSFQLITIDR